MTRNDRLKISITFDRHIEYCDKFFEVENAIIIFMQDYLFDSYLPSVYFGRLVPGRVVTVRTSFTLHRQAKLRATIGRQSVAMTILAFPEACAGQPILDDADRSPRAGQSEVIVFPRLSMRTLHRLWGVPEEASPETGPDDRALAPECRDARS